MTCLQARSLIEDYVDHELPEPLSAALEEHLSNCPHCRADYEASLALKQLLVRTPVDYPGQEYFDEVRNIILARTVEADPTERVIKTHKDDRSEKRKSFMRSLVSVAASLCIFFSALLLGSRHEFGTSALSRVPQTSDSTFSLTELVNAESSPGFTKADQERMVGAMILLGPPGILGRFTNIADVLSGR